MKLVKFTDEQHAYLVNMLQKRVAVIKASWVGMEQNIIEVLEEATDDA